MTELRSAESRTEVPAKGGFFAAPQSDPTI